MRVTLLCFRPQVPLHVRAQAEAWELPRAEVCVLHASAEELFVSGGDELFVDALQHLPDLPSFPCHVATGVTEQ